MYFKSVISGGKLQVGQIQGNRLHFDARNGLLLTAVVCFPHVCQHWVIYRKNFN